MRTSKTGFFADKVTVKQAAREQGKRISFIRKLINDGHLAAWKDGRRLLVKPQDVSETIERVLRYTPPAKPTRQSRRAAVPLHEDVRF